MYERFKNLCKERGISITQALDELGIARGMAANWRARNSLPSGQTAIKIADYFGITTDEVLGRTPVPDESKITLSDNEQILVNWFRKSDESSKEHILKYIEFLSQQKSVPPEGN